MFVFGLCAVHIHLHVCWRSQEGYLWVYCYSADTVITLDAVDYYGCTIRKSIHTGSMCISNMGFYYYFIEVREAVENELESGTPLKKVKRKTIWS